MSLIFNLSGQRLCDDENSILNRGLSFVPTSPLNPFQVQVELFKFFRSIKLKYFYGKGKTNKPLTAQNAANEVNAPLPFKVKSKFCPQVNCANIETFCNLVQRDVSELLQSPRSYSRSNCTPGERTALSALSKNQNITVKPADKGGGIVLMDTNMYDDEINSQLADCKFYKKIAK